MRGQSEPCGEKLQEPLWQGDPDTQEKNKYFSLTTTGDKFCLHDTEQPELQ